MKIGNSLSLEIKEPETNEMVKFTCKIVDKAKDHLFIDYPIYEKTRKTAFFPIGTKIKVTYVADDHNVYHFLSEIIAKRNLTVPALMIKIPEKEKIKKIQRREYVRVPVAVDIAVHDKKNRFTPFTTITVDVSGGGISFVLPNELLLNRGDQIIIWMVLNFTPDKYEYLKLEAEIVRINNRENTTPTASAKFLFYNTKEQQTIIQFCFERMRQARKKELI